MFSTELGKGKMPHNLDYPKVKKCLSNADDNPNFACKLLKSMRLRININEDEYVKLRIG